ncbi:MAG: LamG domain-containing protein, partial [Deltaproteobacteria bacterium]
TNVGGVSTIEPAPPTNAYSAQTNTFPGGGPVNPDGDPDLVVYYDFNDSGSGDFLENKATNTLGSYNLTAAGSEIVTAGSRFTGNTAAYFDANEGYAYANDVNQTNITELDNTGNFTISTWIYPDQDMSKFASVMSTGDQTSKDLAAFQISQTSSSPNPNKIGMFAQNTSLRLDGPAMTDNTWYHVTFTKEQNGLDNGTGTFYVDGVQVDNETNFKTGFLKLKIGINRVTQNNWKGYIDEFKIYKRALTGAEVTNLYNNGTP